MRSLLPFVAAVATVHPTPFRRAQKLCLVPLFLLTEPLDAGSPLDAASTTIPLVGHRRSSLSICCLRCLPELTDSPVVINVSF